MRGINPEKEEEKKDRLQPGAIYKNSLLLGLVPAPGWTLQLPQAQFQPHSTAKHFSTHSTSIEDYLF